jgi:polysaccharide export outer membrane protein
LNEVQAAGLTPDQLRDVLEREAKKLLEDPNTTVVVKEINSRKVFVTGQVAKPGSFPLNVPMTVLQAIAEAGGLLEYAQSKNIVVLRNENGKTSRLPFNYKEVVQGKKLETNVQLKPGDTVVVP